MTSHANLRVRHGKGDPKPGTAYAIVRMRGTVNVTGSIKDTMRMLRVAAPNHAAIVPANESTFGMIRKCQDYVAYGEVDTATVVELIRKRGRAIADAPVTDELVNKLSNGKYAGVEAYAAAIAKGEATLTELGEGMKPLFRLQPAKGGHGTIKRHVGAGGPLGYHGAEINELIRRMM